MVLVPGSCLFMENIAKAVSSAQIRYEDLLSVIPMRQYLTVNWRLLPRKAYDSGLSSYGMVADCVQVWK